MKASALVGALIGLAIVVALLALNHAGRIAALIAGAGPGLLLVIALHLPQVAASALGWRPLILNARPRFCVLFRLRLVREAVNALLPVAQVGGDVVRARLLARRGVALDVAAASCTADLTVEMATLAPFALLGVGALFLGARSRQTEALAIETALAVVLIAAAFFTAQRLGATRRLAAVLVRVGERARWEGLGALRDLHATLQRIYADPRRLAASATAHLASWLLGVAETASALFVLGLHPGVREALVIESLGQAVRAAGFLVPGALGVQEGGYVLICGLFGVGAEGALALSLVRRVREVALGVFGLLLWRADEGRRPVAQAARAR